jgi:hypothetical protein
MKKYNREGGRMKVGRKPGQKAAHLRQSGNSFSYRLTLKSPQHDALITLIEEYQNTAGLVADRLNSIVSAHADKDKLSEVLKKLNQLLSMDFSAVSPEPAESIGAQVKETAENIDELMGGL